MEAFWKKFDINQALATKNDLEAIQECLKDHYRIILFNYVSVLVFVCVCST